MTGLEIYVKGKYIGFILLFNPEKPGPLVQVRVNWLCQKSLKVPKVLSALKCAEVKEFCQLYKNSGAKRLHNLRHFSSLKALGTCPICRKHALSGANQSLVLWAWILHY